MLGIKNRMIAILTALMLIVPAPSAVLANKNNTDNKTKSINVTDPDIIAYAELGTDIAQTGVKAAMGDVNSPKISIRDGKEGWLLNPNDGVQSRYICMDIDDNLTGYDDNSLYELTVEYYDEGYSSLVATYTKHEVQNPSYKKRHWGQVIEKVENVDTEILDFTDTKIWKSHSWIIDGPAMKNTLNGYDLRVGIHGTKLGYSTGSAVVSSVKLKKLNKKRFVNIKVSSENYGNIFFTGDEMKFNIDFNNNINQAAGAKYGTYNTDVTYTLTDSIGGIVETKHDTVKIKPYETSKKKVTFNVDKYDVYLLKVEINNDELGLYSDTTSKCSYVRSTRGKIINPRCGTSTANTQEGDEIGKLINYAGIQYARINLSSRFIIRSSYDDVTPAGTPALGGPYKEFVKALLDNNVKVTAYHGNDQTSIIYSEDKSRMPNTDLGRQRWTEAESAAIDWFGDSITVWEIFNEANLLTPFREDRYAVPTAELIKYEYPILKKRHPNVIIGGPQVTVVGNSNVYINGYYPEIFIKNGGADDIDFFSQHCYLWGKDPITNSPVDYPEGGSVKDYKELMRKYGVKNKEVWCTEYGYAAYHKGCRDEQQQAAWNIQQTLMMCEDNATDKYFIFRIDNAYTEDRTDPEKNFGLIGVVSYNGIPEIKDKAHAKPGYLAFSNFNILMYDAEYYSRVDVNKNTLGYRYKKTETDTDLLTLFTNKDSDKVSVDLGTNSVTLTDMFGNEQKLISNDGKYTFTVTQEPFYVEGKFNNFEIVDDSSAAPNLSEVSGFFDSTAVINMHNTTGENLKVEAAYVDVNNKHNVYNTELNDKNGALKLDLNSDALRGYDPVYVKIYNDKGVYFSGNVFINYDKPVAINYEAYIDSEFNWHLKASVTSKLNDENIEGTLKFIRPTEWIDAVPDKHMVIQPGETYTFETLLPKSIESQNGRETTYAFIFDDENMAGIYGVKTFDLVYAKKAKDIVIDGNLDDWTDGWMMLNTPEQFLSPVGYQNEYTGVTDIWGKVAVKWDEEKLYFAAYVDDDKFYCTDVDRSRLWFTDGVQLGIVYDPNGKYSGTQYEEYAMGLLDGVPSIYRHVTNMPYKTNEESTQVPGVELMIKNEGRITIYEMSVPWTSIIPPDDRLTVGAGSVIKFGCIINENDGNGRKGYYKLANDGVGSNKNSDDFAKLLLCD